MNFHDLVFYSKHHYRFECGVEIGGGAAKRAIRIQDSISGNEGYSVTIYDTEENEVLRADRVSMSTKPMKIISSSFDETTMQGWGCIYTSVWRHSDSLFQLWIDHISSGRNDSKNHFAYV